MIKRGRGGWSVGIKKCCRVRGEKVAERLRGKTMQEFKEGGNVYREGGRDV